MAFPTTSADVEVLVRGLIATKAAGVDGVENVFSGPIHIPDIDAARTQLGFTTPEGIEIRYLSIQWIGWDDTEKGCDENPVYNLNYTIRVGQEFVPARAAGGNSETEFTATCLNLRDALLVGKELGWPSQPGGGGSLYCEKLVLSEEVGLADDPNSGMFGHTVEFLIKVEVTPSG